MTKRNKYFIALPSIIIVIAILSICRMLFGNGVLFKGERSILIIPTGAGYEQVLDSIYSNLHIKNRSLFEWVSGKKKYPSLIKPGRYVISDNLSYLRFVDILRSGKQTPVSVTINNARTVWQLAGKVGGEIEADSLQIAEFLTDPSNYARDGFKRENIISVFIPNTYEFYWNTSASGFYNRMLKEYRRFWTDERTGKAGTRNMTRIEVSVLASIIDAETANSAEKPRIAGVYLNRLKLGMPLQSDPTIRFALNDFTIKRILNKQLQTESPYNTYKHAGLPPGPIGCPTVEGIEAVLNAEKNDYLYFVAKADLSGAHNFSRTLTEHHKYAAEYQKELDRRKIFR
jgi:UPF0755 protein